MRKPYQSAFTNFSLAVVVVLSATGCEVAEPVVPQAVYERVNDDGRAWTYDSGWQHIRRLNANLDAKNLETVDSDALLIASQMERLETGKAGPLSSREVRDLLEEASRASETRNSSENLLVARDLGQKLQESFDAGDFYSAKTYALSLHATMLSRDNSD